MSNPIKMLVIGLLIIGLVFSSGCIGNDASQQQAGGDSAGNTGTTIGTGNGAGGNIPQPPAFPE